MIKRKGVILMTLGRNDPCPCGSGKKYKRCHGAKDVVSVQKVVDDELLQIVEYYYAEYPKNNKDLFDLNMLMNTWVSKLSGVWEEEQIELLTLDYYLLIKNQVQWNNYIEKQMKKSLRPAVAQVVEQWTNPMILIGKVIDVEEKIILVEDVISGNRYEVEKLEDMDIDKLSYVMGIVFPDSRKGPNGLSVVTGLIIISKMLEKEMKKIKDFAKKSKLDSQVFLKKNLLECCEILLEDENNKPEIPPLHLEMLDILDDFMKEIGLIDDMLMVIFGAYLTEYSPNPRKLEAAVAGAVRFGKEYLRIDDFAWTNKDIAEMFGVSTSTIQKYFEEIEEFYFAIGKELVEKLKVNQPLNNNGFEIGTYPRFSEYRNWEILMHMNSVEAENEEEMKELVSQFMNVSYIPKNKFEEAQLNAYEGYFAETEQLKNNYWKIAELLNPNNTDVLLHKAEITNNENIARELFKKAIKESHKQFDPSFEVAWGYVPNRPYLRSLFAYGIWEFELGNFEVAKTQFQKLIKINPTDNQGVRYLLVSTLLHLNLLEAAKKVLETYPESDDAIYEYLSYQTEKMLRSSQGKLLNEKQLEPIMEKLAKLNPLALYLLANNDIASEPYPKSAVITARSQEEAQLIHMLLGGFDIRE